MKLSCFLLIFTIIFSSFSAAQSSESSQDYEEKLIRTLNDIKQKCEFLVNKNFEALPTENDLLLLEKKLGYELPQSLKLFHLYLGNLVFGEIDTQPTAHNDKEKGNYDSELYRYFVERYKDGITDTWIPFCTINGAIVCIIKDSKPGNDEVGYFTNSWSGLKIDGDIRPNFLTWLLETFQVT